mgnify:CR=1 FL=1
MSHGRLRKEKVCLNCNARTLGPYCHVCGQQNVEPKETAVDLVVHFFNDITHFEGKFITSLRYILFRPGFLTQEYIRGRRASYMNPIRMYVFTSAFFFILFFTLFDSKEMFDFNKRNKFTASQEKLYNEALAKAESKQDSATIQRLFGNGKTDTLSSQIKKKSNDLNIAFTEGDASKYETVAQYDSVQQALPKEKRDSWLKRLGMKRTISIKERYDGDMYSFFKDATEYFVHSFPKILFVSLPLFAFVLMLLYIRHKQWYYVNHVIFTIHYFVFSFLWLVVLFAMQKLETWLPFLGASVFSILWNLYFFGYLYKAMRNVYGQSRKKTILKFILLFLAMCSISLLLFAIFFSYTIFTM